GTVTNGVGNLSATLKTAGNQTITATDSSDNLITDTSNTILLSAAAATHFSVSAPASATAGSAFSFTVTALDQFNNVDTGYSGVVTFTSSDGLAVLPGDATLTNGLATLSATLKTAGNQAITAADTLITGTSHITVNAAAATHFGVSAPASTTAGNAFSFTVTALDPFENTDSGYSGTLQFTSSDIQAILPADSGLTNGVGTFSATLKTAGNRTITATDTTANGSITGVGNVNVNPGAATHFTVSTPATVSSRIAFNVTVVAFDQFNNTATGYAGVVHFTSSDVWATLPADSTLTAGVGTFAATLRVGGNQTITATDPVNGAVTGASGIIDVKAATSLSVTVSAADKQVYRYALNQSGGTSYGWGLVAPGQFSSVVATTYGSNHTVIFGLGLDQKVYEAKLDANGNL